MEVDYSPFQETADLLYEGPWVAERLAAVENEFDHNPDIFNATTLKIIGNGKKYSSVDTFRALYRLEALRKVVAPVWKTIDYLVTPTVGTQYTIAEVNADPVQKNTNNGYYTNFMNLLDMAAVALPAGFQPGNKMPFGITVSAPAPCDKELLDLGARFQKITGILLGKTGETLIATSSPSSPFVVV